MKCPKCKAEMEEGKLLCEKCGEEVMIVPDFDYEVEQEINRTLRSMAEDFAQNSAADEEKELDTDEFEGIDDFTDLEDVMADSLKDYLPSWGVRIKPTTRRFIIMFIVFVAVILLIGAGSKVTTSLIQSNSFDYQYDKGMEYYNNSQYLEALEYLEKASEIEPEHVQVRYQMALCYEQLGQIKSTMLMCHEVLGMEGGQFAEVYDKLLNIYLENEEYEELWNILKECELEDICSKYKEYAAYAPSFDQKEGVYDEQISISLDAESEGLIYYTIDGSKPSKNSNVYQKPILLQEGEYEINAMFVNMQGIQSDIVTKNYYIKLAAPVAPEVSLDSDTYTEPVFIEIYHSNNTKIYYTKDGSTPTEKSYRYTDKIELPLGLSNYAFVAIDDKGLSSEVVKRTYNFDLEANFDEDLALQVLLNHLLVNGKINDLEGHVPNNAGINIYTVKTAVEMNGSNYYIVHEEYENEYGEMSNIKNIYAIDCETAELFSALKIKEGQYHLRSIAQ